MKNQHKKISGYRELSSEEIETMNQIKALGEKFGDIIDKLNKTPSTDKRWLEIGTSDVQKGIMSLVRSIAKPTTF